MCSVLALGMSLPNAAAQLADPSTPAGPTTPDDPQQDPSQERGGIIQPVTRPGPARPVVPGLPSLSDAIDGLGGYDVRAPASMLIPEGTFLVRQRGVLIRARTGEWIMAFSQPKDENSRDAPGTATSPDAQAPALSLPPMVLLPCWTLSKIEATLMPGGVDESIGRGEQSDSRPVPIELSGRVLIYHQRNYVLPTVYRFLDPAPESTSPARQGANSPTATQSEAARSSPPLAPRAEDPRVAELIEELEAGRRTGIPGRSGIDARPSGHAPDAAEPPGAEAAGQNLEGQDRSVLIDDGRTIVRSRGHLIRLPDGSWAFSSGSDPDSPGPGPMPLLPSSALEQAERLIQREEESPAVIVSGQIFVYGETRYLLPSAVLLDEGTGGITPHQ